MMQDSPRDNVSSSWTASINSFFDDFDTTILLQLLPARIELVCSEEVDSSERFAYLDK
jgi:hypothetical protein